MIWAHANILASLMGQMSMGVGDDLGQRARLWLGTRRSLKGFATALHPSTTSRHCSTASELRQQCLQNLAVRPGSAFTMWQHCLQTVVPVPLEFCMPLECCTIASQNCSTGRGQQQQCLQNVAALPVAAAAALFTWQRQCLHNVAALPSNSGATLQCCMPLECCSTASQHCSTASGLQQHCLQNVAALPVDGSSTVVGQ